MSSQHVACCWTKYFILFYFFFWKLELPTNFFVSLLGSHTVILFFTAFFGSHVVSFILCVDVYRDWTCVFHKFISNNWQLLMQERYLLVLCGVSGSLVCWLFWPIKHFVFTWNTFVVLTMANHTRRFYWSCGSSRSRVLCLSKRASSPEVPAILQLRELFLKWRDALGLRIFRAPSAGQPDASRFIQWIWPRLVTVPRTCWSKLVCGIAMVRSDLSMNFQVPWRACPICERKWSFLTRIAASSFATTIRIGICVWRSARWFHLVFQGYSRQICFIQSRFRSLRFSSGFLKNRKMSRCEKLEPVISCRSAAQVHDGQGTSSASPTADFWCIWCL